MKSTFFNLSLLCFGIILGWYANNHFSSLKTVSPDTPLRHSSNWLALIQWPKDGVNLYSTNQAANAQVKSKGDTATESQTQPSQTKIKTPSYITPFIDKLREGRYEQAMRYYEEIEAVDEKRTAHLKHAFLSEMSAWLSQGMAQAAIEAQQEFLNLYYNDMAVLKLLARSYAQIDNIEQSIRTYFLAILYAPDQTTINEINLIITKVTSALDKRLSENKSWPALIELYLLLIDLNPDYPGYRFRLAQVFHNAGDDDSALLNLADIINIPQWSVQANALLMEIKPDKNQKTAIALKKRGMHYLVNATIDQEAKVSLLIDTGASLTVLSQAAFEDINTEINFDFQGYRPMNTANGIANSAIYQVSELTIDQHSISDVTIAVLDYQPSRGVDGLLGMNVLSHFHFEIDQSNKVLNLIPR